MGGRAGSAGEREFAELGAEGAKRRDSVWAHDGCVHVGTGKEWRANSKKWPLY
jgi:hypothetical protein